MSYLQHAIRASIIIFVLSLVGRAVGYIARVVFTYNLTVEQYGLLTAILGLFGLIGIFSDFGLASSLKKFIPVWQVKKDDQSLLSGIRYVLLFRTLASLGLALVLALGSSLLLQFYFKADNYVLFFILLGHFVLYSAVETYSAISVGLQKQAYFAAIEPIRMVSVVVLFLVLLYFAPALEAAGIAYALANVVIIVLFTYLLLKHIPLAILSKQTSDKNKFVELKQSLWKFGVPIMVAYFGARFITYTDTIMLTVLTDLSSVGLYNVALPTANILLLFSAIFASVILPMVSELHAKKSNKSIRKGLALSHKIVFIIMLPAVLFFAVFSDTLLKVLFSDVYRQAAFPLSILAVGTLFYTLSTINLNTINGFGKSKLTSNSFWAGAIANVVANLALIPLFGIIGAALGTFIGYIILFGISSWYTANLCKYIPPFWQLFKIIVANAVFLGLLWLVKDIMLASYILKIIVVLFIAGLGYLAALYSLKIVTIADIKKLIKIAL